MASDEMLLKRKRSHLEDAEGSVLPTGLPPVIDARLLESHDNLWLDTTMTLADYFPGQTRPDLESLRHDRVMYGSDFPNIPYAWDRELKVIKQLTLDPAYLARLLSGNAREFYRID